MHPNEELIQAFYQAFQRRDFKTMQSFYTDHATFSDSIFVSLRGDEVKVMWEMLCIRAKDLQIECKNIKANEKEGSAEWKAIYKLSATNRRVVNQIKAHFVFENGKIKQHQDYFSFYKWIRQAIGWKGWLLGWTPFFRKYVRQAALNGLFLYMKKK